MIKKTQLQVAVKIKPSPSPRSVESLVGPRGKLQLKMQLEGQTSNKYVAIDHIHDANYSQKTMYQDCGVHQIVKRFIGGDNAAIIVYGPTGTGKTFALEGDHEHEGILKSCITQFYKLANPGAKFKCSFIQLYNESLYDMFSDEGRDLSKPLKMHWEEEKEFVVQDLIEKSCSDETEMLTSWVKGTKNRFNAITRMNSNSSRSHSIFQVSMTDEDGSGNIRKRQMIFVDLAGSERVHDNIGRLTKETIEINKSLFFLGKVIKVLQQISCFNKELYIPYRDSKLTSLLKKAFGGNCVSLMIACLDGDFSHQDENLSTLNYAVSARKIVNHVKVNIDPKARENMELHIENNKLKNQLALAARQVESFKMMAKETLNRTHRQDTSEYASQIVQCIGTVRELLQSNKQLRQELDLQKKFRAQCQLQLKHLSNESKIQKPKIIFENPQLAEHSQSSESKLRPLSLPRQPQFRDSLVCDLSNLAQKSNRKSNHRYKTQSINSPGTNPESEKNIQSFYHLNRKKQSFLKRKRDSNLKLPENSQLRFPKVVSPFDK